MFILSKKKALGSSAILVLLISAIGLLVFPPQTLYNQITGKVAISGFQSSLVLNDYQMKNQDDKEVRWSDFKNKPMFITTGFTSCSYTCPISVAFFQKLAEKTKDAAVYSFLTIDPLNDKPEVLKRYLQAFNKDFIGLYIANSTLFNKALSDLRQSISDLPGEHDIVHSDLIYLSHPKLEGLVIYSPYNLDDIISDLAVLQNIQ